MNLIPVILALAPQPKPGEQAPPAWTSLVPLVLLVVVFYFILIRPQQKRARQQADMVKSVRPGDKIVTNGGLVATVVSVKEKTITIRSGEAKLELAKTAIADITERSGEPSGS